MIDPLCAIARRPGFARRLAQKMISNKKRKDPVGLEASPTITKRIEQK
jgi:hypothetical protein